MSHVYDQRTWYLTNFQMITQRYPCTQFDYEWFSWMKVDHFNLPGGWRYGSIQLLVTLPGLYGDISFQKPDGFYLTKGLRTLSGRMPTHIFEDSSSFNDRSHLGWARYSLHLKNWNPQPDGYSGDNLLTTLQLVYGGLRILAQQTDGRK